MPKDYAKRRKSTAPASQTLSLRTLFLGLFLGLLIATLVTWQWNRLQPSGLSTATLLNFATPQKAGPKSTPAPTKPIRAGNPRFEFYTILPEMEVSVTKPETPQNTPPPVKSVPPSTIITATPPAPTVQATPDQVSPQFILQLASFKQYADAERLKAQLILSVGIEVDIQSVHIRDGETWYRVRSKPYRELAQAEKDRERLLTQNIHSLLIKPHG